MTTEIEQRTGRWKLTEKGSQFGIILRSPVRVESDLAKSAHGDLLLLPVLLTDRAKKPLPVGENPGNEVDSPPIKY